MLNRYEFQFEKVVHYHHAPQIAILKSRHLLSIATLVGVEK